MKPSILISLAAGAMLGVALVFTVRSLAARRDAESALAALSQRRAALSEELRQAKQRIRSAEESAAALQGALDAAAARPATAAPASIALAPSQPMNPRDLLTNDPRLQALWLKSGRSAVLRQYAPLFAALQLSPEQIARFQENVLRQQEQLMDLAGAAQSQGEASRQAVETLRAKIRDEFQAAQADLLGAQGVQRWRDYERTAGLRSIVEGFAGNAVLHGVPLTANQAERLADLLARSTRTNSASRADPTTINWTAVDAALPEILTPTQATLFQTAAPLTNSLSRWTLALDASVTRAQQTEHGKSRDGGSNPPVN